MTEINKWLKGRKAIEARQNFEILHSAVRFLFSIQPLNHAEIR
jgi:hypothetical protein